MLGQTSSPRPAVAAACCSAPSAKGEGGGPEDEKAAPFAASHTDFAKVVASWLEGGVVATRGKIIYFDNVT